MRKINLLAILFGGLVASGCQISPEKQSSVYSNDDKIASYLNKKTNGTYYDKKSDSNNFPIVEKKKKDALGSAISYVDIPSDSLFKIKKFNEVAATKDSSLNKKVVNFSSKGLTLYDSLMFINDSFQGSFSASSDVVSKKIYIDGFNGSYRQFLEIMAQELGFFYREKEGHISIIDKERFVFTIPPHLEDDMVADIKDVLEKSGAEKVSLSRYDSIISFEASYSSFKAIEVYLKKLQEGHATISFDTWIWEVNLSKSNRNGINWENLILKAGDISGSVSGGTSLVAQSGDKGIGISLGDKTSVNSIISFMKEQGSLHTLSHPRISMTSGTKASFNIGFKEVYLAKVTATTSDGDTPVSSSSEVEKDETGLALELKSSFVDGTVYTKMKLDLSESLPHEEVNLYDTTLKLPKSFYREYEGESRILPGEFYLVAGINTKQVSGTNAGLPSLFGKGMIGTHSESESETKELVILMRPRVTVYR